MIEVHHLNNSCSQRVLWMLEELGIEYTIVRYERDAKTMFAPPELKKVHPLGRSPVIRDGDFVLAESGAIIEYLVDRYSNGRFVPARARARVRDVPVLAALRGRLADDATLAQALSRSRRRGREATGRARQRREHARRVRRGVASALRNFDRSGAHGRGRRCFPLEVAVTQGMLNDAHPRLKALLARLHERPAYRAALAKRRAVRLCEIVTSPYFSH